MFDLSVEPPSPLRLPRKSCEHLHLKENRYFLHVTVISTTIPPTVVTTANQKTSIASSAQTTGGTSNIPTADTSGSTMMPMTTYMQTMISPTSNPSRMTLSPEMYTSHTAMASKTSTIEVTSVNVSMGTEIITKATGSSRMIENVSTTTRKTTGLSLTNMTLLSMHTCTCIHRTLFIWNA
jgi:hypothetical protein